MSQSPHNISIENNLNNTTDIITMSVSAQSPHIQPSLTIERETEFITAASTALYEYVEPALLKAVCSSNQLQEVFDDNRFAQSATRKMTKFLNEKEQLKSYRKLQNKQNGLIKVPYYKSKCGFGRAYVSKCLGFTNLRRELRNTLIKHNYVDIDLENAQISIACALCESAGFQDIQHLKIYVSDRNNILQELMARYECDRKTAKNCMINLTFGGRFDWWASKNKIANRQEWNFLTCFQSELNKVAYFFKTRNPILYESCRQQKETKNADKEVREGEVMRSFIAIYLQHWECKIISTCLQFLHNETTCLDFFGVKVATYEYDGFKILKEGFERFEGDLLRTLEQIVCLRLGIPVVFAIKEMDEFLEIEPLADGNDGEELLPTDLLPITDFWEQLRKLTSDTEYALYINKKYPKRFVWCEDKKEWVCWNDVKWEKSGICLLRHISYHIPNALEEQFKPYEAIYKDIIFQKIAQAKENKEEPELSPSEQAYQDAWAFLNGGGMDVPRCLPFRVYVGDNMKIKAVAECCKTWLRNEGIVFDAKDFLTGFNNGVYDLDTNCFRPYRYDDFVSMTTAFDFLPTFTKMMIGSYNEEGEYQEVENPMNYTEEEATAFRELMGDGRTEEELNGQERVVGELEKMFPDVEVRDLVLTILAKVFYGKPLEYCAVFNGSGGNGKGVLDEFIKYIFGDYCCDADYGLITQDKSKSEGANEALTSIHRKRLVFMSEPEQSSKINNGAFKAISGGGTMSARGIYEKQSKIILAGILILECNVRLKFKDVPKPKGPEHRRLMDILFPSRFTLEESDWDASKHIYPMNCELKSNEWRDAHRNAMYNILIVYALRLRVAHFSFKDFIPQTVKDRVEEYLSACNDLHTIFDEIFERVETQPLSPNNIISIADIAKRVKSHTMFKELPKDKRQEFSKASYLKEFFMTDSKYKMKYDNKVLRFDIQEYDYTNHQQKTVKLKFSEYLVGYRLIDQTGETAIDDEDE
jgi:phage/plasmid-associated DNA primase